MNRLAIVSLISLPIAAAVTVPAGAATAGHIRAMGAHSLVRPDQPNTNIVGQGATAKFVPKKLTAAEDTSGNNCGSGFVSFTVTNTGTKTAFVYYSGSLIFKLKPSLVENICAANFGAGASIVLNLGNKTGSTIYAGHVKVTFSD